MRCPMILAFSSSSARVMSFQVPMGWVAKKLHVSGNIKKGDANGFVQMTAALMTTAPTLPGQVAGAANKIMPADQMIAAYVPIVGNTAPGPRFQAVIPCEMPKDAGEDFVGVELTFLENAQCVVSLEIEPVV